MKGLVDILSTIFDYKAGSSEGLRLLKTTPIQIWQRGVMAFNEVHVVAASIKFGLQVSRYAPDTDLPFQGFDAYGNPHYSVLRLPRRFFGPNYLLPSVLTFPSSVWVPAVLRARVECPNNVVNHGVTEHEDQNVIVVMASGNGSQIS